MGISSTSLMPLVVRKTTSPTPFDLLPIELVDKIWDLISSNGDAHKAAKVCRKFQIMDTNYRLFRFLKILDEARKNRSFLPTLVLEEVQNNSPALATATYPQKDPPPAMRYQLGEINALVIRKIRALRETCPQDVVLTVEEIKRYSKNIEGPTLKKCWGPLRKQIARVCSVATLAPPYQMTAEQIQVWISKNPGSFLGISYLTLSSSDLDFLPNQIVANAPNLQRLYLSNNKLDRLPFDFGKLLNLQELILSNNAFSQFPKIICQLARLIELHLSANQIETVPPDIGQLIDLKILLLDGNRLRSLPSQIGNLSNLVQLALSQNPLERLPEKILWLKNAKISGISGVPLENSDT